MKYLSKLAFIYILSTSLFAQDRTELQQRKKKLVEEINFSNTVLKQTQKDKNLSYSQLKTLEQKIAIRNQLIRMIQSEIGALNEEIVLSQNASIQLSAQIDTLKREYAELIVRAYKSGMHFNRILFIFSSKNFNQAYKRITYISQIARYREQQAQQIKDKQERLEKVILVLEKQKEIKENLVKDKRSENNLLSQEQSQKSFSLAALSQKEKELKKALEDKNKQRKKIQKEIERIIAEELRKATETSSSKSFASTPEAIALSNTFTSNKGKLPWPVLKGLVISNYGKQKHPVLSGIYIENNGIEIATEAHSSCRAVFEGKVSSVLRLPNGTKAVMIRHGGYITVYSNLSEVFVEKEESIDTKQEIGLIYTSKQEKSTVVDFQLWKGSEKLNPQLWLMRK